MVCAMSKRPNAAQLSWGSGKGMKGCSRARRSTRTPSTQAEPTRVGRVAVQHKQQVGATRMNRKLKASQIKS